MRRESGRLEPLVGSEGTFGGGLGYDGWRADTRLELFSPGTTTLRVCRRRSSVTNPGADGRLLSNGRPAP